MVPIRDRNQGRGGQARPNLSRVFSCIYICAKKVAYLYRIIKGKGSAREIANKFFNVKNRIIMGLLCNCPQAAAITDVPISDCPESMGQIQKAVLQRVFSTGNTKNTIADPTLLASWTPLLAAADGTKVVQTPYLNAPATEPGAARTYGGGNETLGGIELIIGREPTAFTANILRSGQATIAALKTYQCENAGVYLIDEHGRIGCLADDIDNPTTYYPIPVAGFFVGDKTFGGLEAPDMNGIQWKFFPNWSDKFVMVTPADFSALTDLVTP